MSNLNQQFNNRRRAAFTLVELLLVVAIIGVLASLALAVVAGAQNEARRSATVARLGQIRAMMLDRIESYEFRRVPLDLQRFKVGDDGSGTLNRDEVRQVNNRIIADMINTEMPRAEAGGLGSNLGIFPSNKLQNWLRNVLGNRTMDEPEYPPGTRCSEALIKELGYDNGRGQESMILRQLRSLALQKSRNFLDTSSEGLWFVLLTTDVDGTSGVDALGSRAFADDDGDGLMSVVDAWNDEIEFAFYVADENGNLYSDARGQPHRIERSDRAKRAARYDTRSNRNSENLRQLPERTTPCNDRSLLPKNMNMQFNHLRSSTRRGVTLVEILVVITIMSVLTLLIVPRVRTINKDRNIRESARVVGSMFANASQRAAADGRKAGVLIRRNSNFVDANYRDANNRAIPYAATTLFLMRAVPDFTGDDASARATQLSPTVCRIDNPLEADVVQPNDRIFLNNQQFGYRIKTVTPDSSNQFLDLELETYANSSYVSVRRTTLPPLNFSTDIPFRIERRPRVVQSSAIDLPAGYQIDLRFSGWFVDDSGGPFPMHSAIFMNMNDVDPDNDPTTIDTDIQVVFNEFGGIESVEYGSDFNLNYLPTSSLYLFVTEDDLKLGPNQDPLVRDSNLWVTVGNHNGGTSIGYNASPNGFVNNTPIGTPLAYYLGAGIGRQSSKCKSIMVHHLNTKHQPALPRPELTVMPISIQPNSAEHSVSSTRAGITIVEVLTAMVVAMIGVFGVMILIPFAVKQAEVGLDLDEARRQAENGIAQFEISGFERLVENPALNDNTLRPLWIDTNGNQILQPDVYAIDPLSIFANDPTDGYDQFPPSFSIEQFENGLSTVPADLSQRHFPFIGELNLADYDANAANVNDVVKVWAGDRGEALARRIFRNSDDLIFGDPVSDLDPPVQFFDADANGAFVGRQARGEMSWMSILVPSFDADNPTGSAWKYRMFVLAFKDRALQTSAQNPVARFPVAEVANRGITDRKDIGYSGGNVTLMSSIAGVRKDDWVMLINLNPELPFGFQKQVAFYRVIATFTDLNTGLGTMTLDGPDFVFNRENPMIPGNYIWMDTYAVHLANYDAAAMQNNQLIRLGQVVSVYERSFVWELESDWNR